MQGKTPNKRAVGGAGEELVCGFLQKNGYRIVCRNYTVRGGEIDIIAEKEGITAFVEVKLRKRGALVSGEESITAGKRRSLVRTAERWCLSHRCGSSRFDVAVLEEDAFGGYKLKYYVSAFDASK
ncbi:MAG: YraN family protein [Ruminococcus sp.]|nr:YraN family protein [Ruminococcus sp.]